MPDGLGVRILESDYLPIREKGEHKKLLMGVQVDDAGRPVKYSLTTEHPGEKYEGQRIVERAAGDVVHVFRQERPGQLRAVSWLTPAMMPIKMLHGYQEAELVAARVASCQMGFYTVAPGNDWGGDGEDAAGNPVTDAAPGTFERLPSGWDFKSFTPTHPTAQYSDFVKAVLREIASGLGVSYSALANDGSDANYSSMREMSILERENWMVLQDWFARAFMRRLYREWIGMAEVKGKFAFNPAPYYEADQWTGRTWPWVDPQKDANARETDVQMGLTAPSVLAEEKGVNYAEMILRIAEDERLRAAAGLPSLFVAKQPAGGTPNA
jgi:lambda family phage portal protein